MALSERYDYEKLANNRIKVTDTYWCESQIYDRHTVEQSIKVLQNIRPRSRQINILIKQYQNILSQF